MYVIYELCAYDRYIQDKISFWCDLLTDNERQILEYGQDIEVKLQSKQYLRKFGFKVFNFGLLSIFNRNCIIVTLLYNDNAYSQTCIGVFFSAIYTA